MTITITIRENTFEYDEAIAVVKVSGPDARLISGGGGTTADFDERRSLREEARDALSVGREDFVYIAEWDLA